MEGLSAGGESIVALGFRCCRPHTSSAKNSRLQGSHQRLRNLRSRNVASNDSRSQKSKEFWNYLEENYKEVTSWPGWMKGEPAKVTENPPQVQCPAAGNDQQTRE